MPKPKSSTTPPGQIAPGNIDLNARPIVHNADGSISTVRSITITQDGKAILIPTVVGDQVVSNDEAIKHYQQTGENLGTFSNESAADSYAQTLHDEQAAQYLPKANATPQGNPFGWDASNTPQSGQSGGSTGTNPEDYIAFLQSLQNGTLPGKTPAAQLNYYQDLVSSLGVDPIQQAGLGDTPPEQYVPKTSKTLTTWGSNPIYKEVFAQIDAGADPTSAFNAVKKAHEKDPNGPVWTDPLDATKLSEDALQIKKVAAEYADERTQNVVDEDAFNAKQAATSGYAKQDGSKYKNAPLGGNGIFDTTSEYDLLGQPTTNDLLATYQQQHPGLHSKSDAQRGIPIPATNRTINPTNHQPNIGEPIGIDAVTGVVDHPVSDGAGVSNAGMAGQWGYKDPTQNAQAAAKRSGYDKQVQTSGKVKEPLTGVGAAHNVDIMTDPNVANSFKLQSQKRIDQTKNTQVRSQANENFMKRVLALRTVLGA